MTYWTLTNNSVEKSFEDWGLEGLNIPITSQVLDVCRFTAPAHDIETPLLFTKLSACIIRRDRVRDVDGNYSGGTQFFRGVFTRAHRFDSTNVEGVTYEVSGLWWFFENLPFEQSHREYAGLNGAHCSGATDDTCETGYVTDGTYDYAVKVNPSVVLNQNYYGAKITVAAQIKEILDFLIANGAPFQYSTAEIDTEFGTQVLPTNEQPDVTCAMALTTELSWIPDCETWFDYSTEVPTFHVKRRASLEVITFDALAGTQISNLKIVERDELQKTQVIITYSIANSVDGRPWVQFTEDIFPASPSNPSPFTKLRQSVDIIGFTGSNQSAPVVTEEFPADLNNVNFWKENLNWLNSVTIASIHGANRTPSVQPRILKDGVIHEWMVAGSTQIVVEDCVINALADITLTDGTIKKDEPISITLRATNATTTTYTKFSLSQGAEPVPTGLAEQIYTALAQPQFEGSFDVTDTEVLSSIAVGKKLNFTGGLAEWETMNMPIKSVTYDVDSGRTSVTFGVNRFLSAGELVDLMRVTRARNVSSLTLSRASASAGSGNVVGGKNTPQKFSASGPGLHEKLIVKKDDIETKFDPANGEMSMVRLGSTAIRMSFSDIAGKTAMFRELRWLDRTQNCKEYHAWVLMTEPQEVV